MASTQYSNYQHLYQGYWFTLTIESLGPLGNALVLRWKKETDTAFDDANNSRFLAIDPTEINNLGALAYFQKYMALTQSVISSHVVAVVASQTAPSPASQTTPTSSGDVYADLGHILASLKTVDGVNDFTISL